MLEVLCILFIPMKEIDERARIVAMVNVESGELSEDIRLDRAMGGRA